MTLDEFLSRLQGVKACGSKHPRNFVFQKPVCEDSSSLALFPLSAAATELTLAEPCSRGIWRKAGNGTVQFSNGYVQTASRSGIELMPEQKELVMHAYDNNEKIIWF